MDTHYLDIAEETRGRHLVGIDPHVFLDEFLPWNETTTDDYENSVPTPKQIASLTSVPVGSQTEHAMYPKYVRYILAPTECNAYG